LAEAEKGCNDCGRLGGGGTTGDKAGLTIAELLLLLLPFCCWADEEDMEER